MTRCHRPPPPVARILRAESMHLIPFHGFGIVRRGDHDATARCRCGDHDSDGRRGDDTEIDHVAAGRHQSIGRSLGEQFAGHPAVTAEAGGRGISGRATPTAIRSRKRSALRPPGSCFPRRCHAAPETESINGAWSVMSGSRCPSSTVAWQPGASSTMARPISMRRRASSGNASCTIVVMMCRAIRSPPTDSIHRTAACR